MHQVSFMLFIHKKIEATPLPHKVSDFKSVSPALFHSTHAHTPTHSHTHKLLLSHASAKETSRTHDLSMASKQVAQQHWGNPAGYGWFINSWQ
jgi:hypothetical protein